MKNIVLLIVAAIFLTAGAAFADTYKEEVINVKNGTTKLKFSGQLSDAAMDALSSGEQVSIQNNLGSYLCAPTKLSQNKKGFGKKTITRNISFKSKNGKFKWTEKDVSANFLFAIGNTVTAPKKATLKSSGTLATKNFMGFDEKDITLFDMLSKEYGLDNVAAYAFTPNVKGANFTYSSEGQDLQVKFSANSKGKVNASYKFSYKAVSPAFLESVAPPITDGYTYMVIDLSGGPNASSYPVSYLGKEPAGGWSDEYKTTKMVLRKIKAGKFTMGSPEEEFGRYNDEVQHEVTLTKDFYIGIFETTQKQYELIIGHNPSAPYNEGIARPVNQITYSEIRGNYKGAGWPDNGEVDSESFLGILRAKTNKYFDIPTEAQWEFACRAGTTTALNDGHSVTNYNEDGNLNKLGRYNHNENDGKGGYTNGTTTVGSYLPNAWGLYDMHGNVNEICLDWYQSDLGIDPVTNPKGAYEGDKRVVRGSCCWDSVRDSRSAYRQTCLGPMSTSGATGFRIVLENESTSTNNYKYSLKIVGDGDVDHGYVGTNQAEFKVSKNKNKFRYYSYNGIKVTDDYLKLQLTEDTEVTAIFGNYNLRVSVSGKGSVSYEFVGQDEVIVTAIPGEQDFDSFELNGTVYKSNPFRFTMTSDTELLAVFKGVPPITDDYTYMVIDLSGGPNAASYPVSYLGKEPAGGWSDEYKTTKLVLRRITPGEFKMGSRDFEVGRASDEVWHNVTLTQPYYISVFEMTQKQYELITGENPSTFKGDLRPADATFKDIRGYDEGIKWPMSKEFDEDSLLGKIQKRTKLRFDLPTEAQWEYACRARTTVAWNNGKVSTGEDEDPELDKLGRYNNNLKDGKGGYEYTTTVGSYLPNAWGLYDMHGNVWEWCLDWYDSYSGNDEIDPVGPNYARNSYEQRVIRGGGIYKNSSLTLESKANQCRSAARNNGRQNPNYQHGIRLVLPTEEGVNEEFSEYVPGVDDDDIGDGDTGETQKYLIVNLENGDWRYRDTEPKGGWPDIYKTEKIVFRLVSPGSFIMGSPEDEVGRDKNEIQHRVTLTQPYYISVFEMTQSQYKLIAGGNPSTFKGDLRPVDLPFKDIRGYNEGVKWPMGKEFDENSVLGRIQEITKRYFDLPTEAQWEHACRAGTTTAWNNGKKSTDKDADPELDKLGRYDNNYKDGKGGYEYTTTVGSYLPNAWGLYDMHGNVYEWCLDWYDFYSDGDEIDPVGPKFARNSYEQRVIRGGGFYKSGSLTIEPKANKCRSAARSTDARQNSSHKHGIRLVLIP